MDPASNQFDFREVLGLLSEPFRPEEVDFLPRNVRDGKALGLAYVNPRHYSTRLNEVAGGYWSDHYALSFSPKGDQAIVLCALTIGDVTRYGDGVESMSDENAVTSASSMAFKRACVKFGLGAYLYHVPKRRGEYDERFKRFTDGGLAFLRKVVLGGSTNIARGE